MNNTQGKSQTVTISQAVNMAMDEELARDPTVVLLGEDIRQGVFRGTAGLVDTHGESRVRDSPISESALVGCAVGAAATGLRPIVEIMYSDFLGLAMDQIMNQAALMRYMFGGKIRLPLTIRTTEGGGIQTAAQHSKTLHHVFAGLPGIQVVCPATPAEAKGLLKAAIRSDNPVICFENKTLYHLKGEVPDDPDYVIPLGKAAVMREGDDVTVVATHTYVHKALEAAEQVEASVEVINPRTLYPLDKETILTSVRKTGRLIVADESPLSYGTHAEIVALVVEGAFFDLDAPPKRIGVPDVPMPFSPLLEKEVLPQVEDIVAAIRKITGE